MFVDSQSPKNRMKNQQRRGLGREHEKRPAFKGYLEEGAFKGILF